jgi:hypothetical protein
MDELREHRFCCMTLHEIIRQKTKVISKDKKTIILKTKCKYADIIEYGGQKLINGYNRFKI